MSTQDGDPKPFPTATAVPGTRLVTGILVAGTLVFLAVAVKTYPTPGIPSLSDMEKATASAPRVIVECQTTYMGDLPSETCYWTLRLDDGEELSWPGAKSKESSGQVREYLRARGPITVRFWDRTLYQIELRNGEVYLDYEAVSDFVKEKQWIGVVLGFVVAAMSLLSVALELRYLRHLGDDPRTAARAGQLGAYVGLGCLGGAVLVGAAGTQRMWTGVVGLALVAVVVPAYDQTIIRRAMARAHWT